MFTEFLNQIAAFYIMSCLLFGLLHPAIHLPRWIDFLLIIGSLASIGVMLHPSSNESITTFIVVLSILSSVSIYRLWKRSITHKNEV